MLPVQPGSVLHHMLQVHHQGKGFRHLRVWQIQECLPYRMGFSMSVRLREPAPVSIHAYHR